MQGINAVKFSNEGIVIGKEEVIISFAEEKEGYTWSSKDAEVDEIERVGDSAITVKTLEFISLLATEEGPV